jgi:hypothetical protein
MTSQFQPRLAALRYIYHGGECNAHGYPDSGLTLVGLELSPG